MKTKLSQTRLTALIAGGLLLTANAFGQFIDSPKELNNAALRASPRALEMFPQLRKGDASKTSTGPKLPTMATPRGIEEFPVLARGSMDKTTAGGACARICKITSNAAIAASPRTLEEFPELVQGTFCCGGGMRLSTK